MGKVLDISEPCLKFLLNFENAFCLMLYAQAFWNLSTVLKATSHVSNGLHGKHIVSSFREAPFVKQRCKNESRFPACGRLLGMTLDDFSSPLKIQDVEVVVHCDFRLAMRRARRNAVRT